MYKIVPNLRNAQCLSTLNRWELRTDGNEFIGCFAREEVAKEVKEALEKYHQKQVKEINFFSWYNPNREEKVFSFNGESAAFVWIPPGEFMMGSPEDESGRYNDESPQHLVRFASGFWMQTTPVTQAQWQAVMGNNPAYFKSVGSDAPVERVSWNDVQEFIQKLNSTTKETQFRLPTEAEWEYACRAGSTTAYCFGDDESLLEQYAWYDKNAGDTTHPVGQLTPNAWGLYDMHGNVWEWCADWQGDYPSGAVTDPTGPTSFGAFRALRGGAWFSYARNCRAAYRWRARRPSDRDDSIGFRLVFTE